MRKRHRKYGAARPLPRCIQPRLEGIWECVWFIRRASAPHAWRDRESGELHRSKGQMLWCHSVKLRSPAAAEALTQWWTKNHWHISDWERRRRRKKGSGNVLLILCADRALVMTNMAKANADALEFSIRREAFQPRGLRPRMALHHLRNGVVFHDLHLQFRSYHGARKRLYVRPSEDALNEIATKVKHACRQDLARFRRKPFTIITAYNHAVQPWWERMRYCDWDPAEIKRLDDELFTMLLQRCTVAIRERNRAVLWREQHRPAEKRMETEARPGIDVKDRQLWWWWVRNRAYRMRGQRIWRIGPRQEDAAIPARHQTERGKRRDEAKEAGLTVPPRPPAHREPQPVGDAPLPSVSQERVEGDFGEQLRELEEIARSSKGASSSSSG